MDSYFVAGTWTGALLCYAIQVAWSAWIKKKVAPTSPEIPAKANNTSAPSNSSWFVVPGGRIELGGTGFYIELIANDEDTPYGGFSPEGYLYGRSQELQVMKSYLEKRAVERAEFEPPIGGWKSIGTQEQGGAA